jgi:hypothetical protein
MKIILAIMLGIFAVDAALYAYYVHAGAGVLFAGALAGAGFLVIRKRKAVTPTTGWRLGAAIELTNPDQPEQVSEAIVSPQTLNLGMLLIGSPGSGKTVAVLSYLHQLRTHSIGAGWAFFEGKGDTDIYKKSVAMGEAPTHFFSTELPGSETINLFAGEPNDVVDRLGKILIGETNSTSFYMDEQRAVLARVVPLLRQLPVATNLRDLYVTLCVEDAARELLQQAQDAGADPVSLSLARQWLAIPSKDRIKNIAGLLNRLFVFVSGPYADRLNAYQPDIDIGQVVTSGKSLYLHLPLTNFAKDVAIALVETFGVEARKRQLGGTEGLPSFPLIFDDWGAFFHPGFGPFSARCRSAQMPLNFGFQSRAQLDAVSSVFADELDDTIATKFIMRVQGDATSQYAVRLLGMYDVRDVGTSNSPGEWRDSTSMRYTQKARIEQRQLRELQPGEVYISTLQQRDDRIVNPLWKLRIPEPPYQNWKNIPMPAARTHEEGRGLSLWTRYMNPVRLAEIHADIEAVATEQAARTLGNAARARDDARAQLVINPGLGDIPS